MKRVKGIVALAVSLSLLAACGGAGGSGSKISDDAKEVKIGINYELSGPHATYGTSSTEGFELAIGEINDKGGVDGKQLVGLRGDNKSEATEATQIATKFMTQDGVSAEVGPAVSSTFQATIPVATKNKVPVITSSATADEGITTTNGKVNDYVFRICFKDSFQGVTMAEFAKTNLSATKAVVLADNSSDYAKGLESSFKETFKEKGGQIVGEEAYVQGDKDFNAVLTNLKGKEFDVIYIPGYYQEVGLIIKQARDLGIQQPILGGDGFDSPVLAELAGNAALQKVYFTNHYSELENTPEIAAFTKAYEDKFGKKPDTFAALGYDMGRLVADAIDRADSNQPEKIKEALAATKDFQAITGNLTINEEHDAVKSIIVTELENGKPSKITRVDPS